MSACLGGHLTSDIRGLGRYLSGCSAYYLLSIDIKLSAAIVSLLVTMSVVFRIESACLISAILNFLFLARLGTSQLVSTGQTVTVSGIPYYVPATPLTIVTTRKSRRLHSLGELVPVTVAENPTNLQLTIQGYGEVDDVWSTGFLEGEIRQH